MSDRFFLDTNVFIYSFDSTSPAKARRALTLIREAHSSRKGVVSFQVVQEFFNFALRRTVPPMAIPDATQYLTTILQPLVGVHSSPAFYGEALQMYAHYRLPWYDALIVTAAVEADCAVLYSEDFQDGQRFGKTRVKNPFA
jgi:predicted nucleic acid-binding protein